MKMSKEDILRECIEMKFGTVSKLAKEINTPESTIRNIFTRGFDGIAVSTAIKICRALEIDLDALMNDSLSVRPNPQKENAWAEYVARIGDEDLQFILAVWATLTQEQKSHIKYFLALLHGGYQPPQNPGDNQ